MSVFLLEWTLTTSFDDKHCSIGQSLFDIYHSNISPLVIVVAISDYPTIAQLLRYTCSMSSSMFFSNRLL